MTDMEDILTVKNLSVSFKLPEADVHAVRGVSFSIKKGQTLGLVGESGCGKSVSAFSILRLVAKPGEITGGEVIYGGQNFLSLAEDKMRKIRGREISMIFQEPMISLNPVLTVGFQISESFIIHMGLSKKEAMERSAQALKLVGISDAEKRCKSYPHEFSGGMRQRVMIAMALAASPQLLIADEPTTALDVTIQAQILELLMNIQRERKMSMLLITHDLGVVANLADDIAIMYAGEIVEYGPSSVVMSAPRHPYTKGLFDAMPRIDSAHDELPSISGTVPSLAEIPAGCAFFPRCSFASAECERAIVSLNEVSPGHSVRCLKAIS
jgi:oligopeptide/dipeptide ABC transporter ATP-binding protein